MERRNVLLETRGKGTLVMSWQSISELCPAVVWKAELLNYKLAYLDKDLSSGIDSLPRGRPSQARVWFVSSSLLTDRANLLCVDRHPLRHAKEADGMKEIGINKIKKV